MSSEQRKTFAQLSAELTAAGRLYESRHQFAGFLVADLRATFATVCTGSDWRASWRARVKRSELEMVMAAAKYFHADEPHIVAETATHVEIEGHGYRSW